MQKIAEQPPSKKALAIAQVLSELGFNIQLLGSEKLVFWSVFPLKHHAFEHHTISFMLCSFSSIHRFFPKYFHHKSHL